MPSLNRCTFMGNLGRDPELRYTENGRPVTNFSIAVNRRWQDKSSKEWQEETTWVNCVLWGEPAERAAESLRKGNLVYVEGRYEDDTWEDKDSGKKMHRAMFTINSFQNLTRREDRESTGGGSNAAFDFAAERAERDWDGGGFPADDAGEESQVPPAERVAQPVSPLRSRSGDDLDELPF